MILEASEWNLSIVEEHFEELQSLWLRRLVAIESREWFESDIRKLDARIAAHADSLVLSFEHALAFFLENLQGEQEQVFSAAFPLSYIASTESIELIFSKLEGASLSGMNGFADALSHAEHYPEWTKKHGLVKSASLPVAGVVAYALAMHGMLQSVENVVEMLLKSSEASENVRGWTILNHVRQAKLRPEYIEQAWAHEDPSVGIAATNAAIWTKQPWFESFCLAQCHQSSNHRLSAGKALSIIGRSSHADTIKSILLDEALGPQRIEFASAFGHPSLLPMLVELMCSSDPQVASASMGEFQRMTNLDIESETREKVLSSNQNASELENDFADEVIMPDVDKAKQRMKDHMSEWSSFARLHRGISAETESEVVGSSNADLAAQMEATMRMAFSGSANVTYASRIQTRGRWVIGRLSAR